jgi:hypothetical protein
MISDEQAVKEILKDFMINMHNWEVKCKQRMILEEHGEIMHEDGYKANLEELEAIFGKYCVTPPERSVFYGDPPEYDIEKEIIISISLARKEKFLITTQQLEGFQKKMIYEIIKKPEGWKINKRMTIGAQGKTKKHLL